VHCIVPHSTVLLLYYYTIHTTLYILYSYTIHTCTTHSILFALFCMPSVSKRQRKCDERWNMYESVKTHAPPFISSLYRYIDTSAKCFAAVFVSHYFSKCTVPDAFVTAEKKEKAKHSKRKKSTHNTTKKQKSKEAHKPDSAHTRTPQCSHACSVPCMHTAYPITAPGQLSFSFNFYPL